MPNKGAQLKSVAKTFDILEALAEREQAKASELAASLDLPTSTVHLHLQNLHQLGYLEKQHGEYAPSLSFLQLGFLSRQREPLFRASRGEIDTLAHRLNELSSLAIEYRGEVRIVYNALGEDPPQRVLHDMLSEGSRIPFHCTSLGKAIYSTKGEDEIKGELEREELIPLTSATSTNPELVLDEIFLAKDRGYVLDDEEYIDRIRSVAVPISNDNIDIPAAIAVSGPKGRLTDDTLQETVIPSLRETVDEIDLSLR